MKKQKNNSNSTSGITLVALVITIIVLLILAGVSISIALGENGILTRANKAKIDTEKATAKEKVEIEVLGSYNEFGKLDINSLNTNLSNIKGITGIPITNFPATINVDGYEITIYEEGNVISEEETPSTNVLEGKNIVWLGDSLIRGYGNNDKGFPEYFSELTKSICTNGSTSGSTITIDSPIPMYDQVNTMISMKDTYFQQVDMIILDGGGNDCIGYYIGSFSIDTMKEIGTVNMNETVTSTDSVISDFETIINALKTNFPNAKIMYVDSCDNSEENIGEIVYAWVTPGKTLEDLNNIIGTYYGKTYSTMEEGKSDVIKAYTDGIPALGIDPYVTLIKERMDLLFDEEIPKACNKFGIEYLDISGYIEETDNLYLQGDMIHINDTGYTQLTPYIVSKAESLLR